MMRKRRLCLEQFEARLVLSTYLVHQGGNLQGTIDAAVAGDTILLDHGATFTGPITLRNANATSITIATNSFPLSAGVRVGPSNASSMAKIVSPGSNLPAIQTEPGASHYYLRGLEILPVNSSAVVDTLVTIGDGSSNQGPSTALPNNIVLDQCYIHGWDDQGIKRGVALNDGGTGSQTGVYNSYVSNFKLVGQDSQAIAGWNGTGPDTIQNDYLEAAGEDMLWGGAWSYIQQVPSNITIKDNTFSKQLTWDPYHHHQDKAGWSVKNLLELKNADYVTVENNIFQNNWAGSQDGHSILFTPRGDQSGGPWVTVSNVTFSHNTIDHVMSGFNILGSDDNPPFSGNTVSSQQATNITISDNLCGNDFGSTEWGGNGNGQYPYGHGQFMEIAAGWGGVGTANLHVLNNTILNAFEVLLVSDTHTGFEWENNIQPLGTYGMDVNGYGTSLAGFAAAFPSGYVITNNVIVGTPNPSAYYPSGQWFPATWSAVGFVNYQSNDTGNYLLASTSPFYSDSVGSNIAGFSTALF